MDTKTEMGVVLLKFTLHKLSWQESLISCSEEQQRKMLSSIMFDYHHGTVFQVCLWSPNTLAISDKQKKQMLVQTDFWCYRHWSPCKRRNLGYHWLKIPQVTVKIFQIEARTYYGCLSWPWVTCKETIGGKQRGKDQLFLWGPDRRNKNVGAPEMAMEQEIWNIFSPFGLHFPLCGSCSPLSSPSPSLPGDSGRRGQGE